VVVGDQTTRQAPPVRNHAPLPNAVVLFRVIDPIKSVDEGAELRGCQLTDRLTTLRSLLGRFAALIGRR
jgi:hypothetical protein